MTLRFLTYLVLVPVLVWSVPVFAQEDPATTVAIIYDSGGKFDKGFNQSAFEGMSLAKREFDIPVVEFSPQSPEDLPRLVERAVQSAKHILAIGFTMRPSIELLAAKYPDKMFYLFDAIIEAPNVQSIVFREEQGAYLVGAIAAFVAGDTGKLGFVGGRDVPLIRKFEAGFYQGAREAAPEISLVTGFVGETQEAWRDPFGAYLITRDMIRNGVDIVFAAAGSSSFGVYQAAKDYGALAIGVDANQNYLHPGVMLTSMLKRMDHAVYSAIARINAGDWTPGTLHMGLQEDGVGYAVDSYNADMLGQTVRRRLEDLEARLLAGDIMITLEQD